MLGCLAFTVQNDALEEFDARRLFLNSFDKRKSFCLYSEKNVASRSPTFATKGMHIGLFIDTRTFVRCKHVCRGS